MGQHISYHPDTRARAIVEGNGLFTLSVDDRLVKGKIGAITMQGQAPTWVLREIVVLMNAIKDRHQPEPSIAKLIQPRPSVMAFARAMEETLRKHDAKKGGQNGGNGRSGWRQDAITGLINHAEEELVEIQEELHREKFNGADLAREAVDLGNMAMMIWDRCLQLPEALDGAKAVQS